MSALYKALTDLADARQERNEAEAEELEAKKCDECDGRGWIWEDCAVTHQLGTDWLPHKCGCAACDEVGYTGRDAVAVSERSP